MTATQEAVCPYCWETIELELDLSAGGQTYTEDCAVCCQPLLVRLTVAQDGGYAIDVTREND
jgi:hypothetical protein